MTIKVGEHCSTSAIKKNLIDSLIEVRNMGSFVYVIVWALGQIRIDVTCIFKVFPKLPESRSDVANFGKRETYK